MIIYFLDSSAHVGLAWDGEFLWCVDARAPEYQTIFIDYDPKTIRLRVRFSLSARSLSKYGNNSE
jgi:hypothetical protein